MEKNYRLWNNILGWGVFVAAAITYLLSMQYTVSWWDCGEFISTTYKLEVPHPPGNPTFQIIGRVFTLLAGNDVTKVAAMVNALSALCSAFTILFLFWSITMLAKKIMARQRIMTSGDTIAILGAGLVGALVYAFSDTFWFSAVEGEVYAMSSFFTAIVFWAMLRWENEADKPYATRWIILNAFLIGLAIGVHLLNLLTIPALAYIFYYKKFNRHDWKGWFYTGLISVVVVGLLLWVLIPWTVKFAGYLDLFFVNNIGMPFNSGTFIYFVLLIAALAFGLWYTQKHKKMIISTILLCITFLFVGYSTFFSIVIRADEMLPINMNKPSDPMSMVSYLNRDQYGSNPLFYGQYYSTPSIGYEDGSPQYIKEEIENPKTHKYTHKYIQSGTGGSEPIYPSSGSTIFPRMWSSRSHHVREYERWAGKPQIKISYQTRDGKRDTFLKPTFGQNLKFFFTYQVGHMYFRYLMWNFSGRQNDIEGHGDLRSGNWITGLDFLDAPRLGSQNDLPPSMQNDAHNKYYLLPFILGLIGLLYCLWKDPRTTWIVFLLFFMTGLAIVIYLNQTPIQPRERDYAYAGSFYVFSIWIGFGVLAAYEFLKRYMNEKVVAIAVTVLLLGIPALMLSQNWNDHDRSDNYAAHDYGANFLNSCPPNAILFTVGDNDTYPLWYAQEVEGIRTDIRVINYGLSYNSWYANQAMHKINQSEKLPFTLSMDYYKKGVNDYIYILNSDEKAAVPLQNMIDFIKNKKNQRVVGNEKVSWLPTNNFYLPVNKEIVAASGLLNENEVEKMVDSIPLRVNENGLQRNDLLFLDVLSTNQWERPICFTSPIAIRELTDITPYIHFTGFAYQLLPFRADAYNQHYGGMRTDTVYTFLTEKFLSGALEAPYVSIDRESQRQSEVPQQNLMLLTQALLMKGDTVCAGKVINTFLEKFPDNKFHYTASNSSIIGFIELCFIAENTEAALTISRAIFENSQAELSYFDRQNRSIQNYYKNDISQTKKILTKLASMSLHYEQQGFSQEITDYLAGHP